MYLADFTAPCRLGTPKMLSAYAVIKITVKFVKLVRLTPVPYSIFENLRIETQKLVYLYAQALRVFYSQIISYCCYNLIILTHLLISPIIFTYGKKPYCEALIVWSLRSSGSLSLSCAQEYASSSDICTRQVSHTR